LHPNQSNAGNPNLWIAQTPDTLAKTVYMRGFDENLFRTRRVYDSGKCLFHLCFPWGTEDTVYPNKKLLQKTPAQPNNELAYKL